VRFFTRNAVVFRFQFFAFHVGGNSLISIERADALLLRYRLEQAVGGSGVSAVDVIVVELKDSDGATGLGFSYVLGGAGGEVVLAATRAQLAAHVLKQPAVPPKALWRRVFAGFNRSGLGPNLIGLAAIDVASWDLESRRRGLPLGIAMGGVVRSVPVYGSGGFTAAQTSYEAADAAEGHAARGLTGVKPRVRGARSDVDIMKAVRAAVPKHVHIMVDANEKCDLLGARWLLAAAKEQGALFVEEPLPANALEGYRALAASGVGVAAGEHLQGRAAFLPFISERLVSLIQPDLAMSGGLTPILEIAGLAEAFDIAVSPHFLPGLFAHVAAAAPAMTWLEDFPLLEPLFEGWPDLQANGQMAPRDVPGHGLVLKKSQRQKFAVA
jgi:L-alanine-DL-glutamate epimerase-like enolase superfamily enzyme